MRCYITWLIVINVHAFSQALLVSLRSFLSRYNSIFSKMPSQQLQLKRKLKSEMAQNRQFVTRTTWSCAGHSKACLTRSQNNTPHNILDSLRLATPKTSNPKHIPSRPPEDQEMLPSSLFSYLLELFDVLPVLRSESDLSKASQRVALCFSAYLYRKSHPISSSFIIPEMERILSRRFCRPVVRRLSLDERTRFAPFILTNKVGFSSMRANVLSIDAIERACGMIG